MSRTRADTKVQIAFYVEPALKSWLKKESMKLPPVRGQGKRPENRLSDFGNLILNTYRKGEMQIVGEILGEDEKELLATLREIGMEDRDLYEALTTVVAGAAKNPQIVPLVHGFASLLESSLDLKRRPSRKD